MIYEKAAAELICFAGEDVIVTSPSNVDKPGWGWGDKNHDHGGAPGQTGEHPNGKW